MPSNGVVTPPTAEPRKLNAVHGFTIPRALRSCSDVIAFACVILSLLLEVKEMIGNQSQDNAAKDDDSKCWPAYYRITRMRNGWTSCQGSEVNDSVDGVPDFSTIIAQQLQNLLLTIVAQVSDQGRCQRNGRNQNSDAINDNILGDVRNVIENNDHRGCTYKEFLACNP
ncbi:hypothetical protein Tco_1361270 [Tanacetum coccineum]